MGSDFNEEQTTAILAVRLTGSSLTVLGSLFIIFSMIIFKRFHRLSARLIFWMSVTALITGIVNLLNPANEIDWVCIVQGSVMQWSQQATQMWTCMIALNLYILVFARQLSKSVNVEKYEKFYHVFVWCLCSLFTILPGIFDCFGPAGVWCWITDDGICTVWRFACFYIPLYIYILWVCYVYIHVAVEVRKTFRETRSSSSQDSAADKKRRRKDKRMIRKLIAYPIIFVVVWLPACIQRIQNWVDPGNPIFFLVLLHAIFAPLQGFANAVAYGLDSDLRHRYSAIICCREIDDSKTARMSMDSRRSSSMGAPPAVDDSVSHKKNFTDLFSCLFVW